MKKLAANYVVPETGNLLKNGLLLAEDDGTLVEIIDTGGDLDEMEQLTFHNGILISGFIYSRTNPESSFHRLDSFINQDVAEKDKLSLQEFIEMGKQVQAQFPEMKIPAIMDNLNLELSSHFKREKIKGVFLLIGSDLVNLHFTSKSRLKKLL